MTQLWIFTSRFPYPIEKGDKLRLYFQLKELSKEFDITLFTLAEEEPDPEHEDELLKYCKSLHYYTLSKPAQLLSTFISFAQQQPFQIGYFKNQKLKKLIDLKLREDPPDLIYCHLIRMSEYVRAIPVPKVIDYMDAFSLGMRRASENSESYFWRLFYGMESRLCGYYERYIFKYFQAWTIISQQDKEALQILRNDAVTIVQNGIDLQQFYFEEQMRHHKQIVFIGNLGYAPNVRAVDYLVHEVMPEIWNIHPEMKLMIAGARPAAWMKRLQDERIILRGWVENIRDCYSEGSVFVAPLFTGSGMQNKILEAMAVGLPCVTTSIVNNSIHAEVDQEIMIAEDVHGFIKSIDLLVSDYDTFENIRRAGRKFIENNYPWDKATQPLVNLLNELEQSTKRIHADIK